MDRCAVVHGVVQRFTEVCAEVYGESRGMQKCIEGYRGAQMYMEVHGGITEVLGGVYGGARRWTEGCVEVDRE